MKPRISMITPANIQRLELEISETRLQIAEIFERLGEAREALAKARAKHHLEPPQ